MTEAIDITALALPPAIEALSFDAMAQGTRGTPHDAYRFARGGLMAASGVLGFGA